MLDVKFIKENADLVKAGAKKKYIEVDIDRLLEVDEERRELLSVVEKKRAEQNAASNKISQGVSDRERYRLIDKMKVLKAELQKEEEKLKSVMEEWQKLMVLVPNIPDVSVPEGEDDTSNQETRTWGALPKFDFEPQSHVDLMTDLDMVDFKRGAKVSGFRGYFLKNDGVWLNYAVWQFLQDEFLKRKDFTPIIAPSLVGREAFIGTGYLPQSEEDLYKTQDGNYLAGTSEVPMMGYYMDEVLEQKDLPVKFFAFSPCFRREAGSHGRDTKGIMRVHEFFKFEQIVLCEASHEESVKHHEEITKNTEDLMQKLNIPYRVVVNCGGDLGLGQVKKYDIEAWIPSENKYRETHSSSYFHDFQSRRLNIRYRDKDGTLHFVHSLNNTIIATPRILISIVENNQQTDGSIKIPEVLQKFMGKDVIKKEVV